MGNSLAKDEIQIFLERLSLHYTQPVKLYLLGGSALCYLGSPRRTVDIDCTIEGSTQALVATVESIANDLKMEVEIVPIDEFIPLPPESENRHHPAGQFGSIKVFVFDPYSIALSKLARGFDTDIQDVLFLLEHEFVELDILIAFVEAALPMAWDYDIDPDEMKRYLDLVKSLL